MSATTRFVLAASIMAAAALPTPAQAKILKYHVALNGQYGSSPTGSTAIGHATVHVDTVTRRVSVDLDVAGITIDDLWDKLVAAPIGPIHFHEYGSAMSSGAMSSGAMNSSSMLVLPLPVGPAYRPTPAGLHVTMKDFDYASDAALVQSTLSFDDFVAAINKGLIILNVHTDKFNPGEISGLVVPD